MSIILTSKEYNSYYDQLPLNKVVRHHLHFFRHPYSMYWMASMKFNTMGHNKKPFFSQYLVL